MTNIHGKLIRKGVVDDGSGWKAVVEVWDSGRAYEQVTAGGLDVHQQWFDAECLGQAARSDDGLRGYARCVLAITRLSVLREKLCGLRIG